MAHGTIRIMTANEVEADILAVEEVPWGDKSENRYFDNLQRLVKGKRAKFAGRALDEDTGVAYQIYQLPKVNKEKPVTVFIEDRSVTKVISTLLDDAGNVRRLRVRR